MDRAEQDGIAAATVTELSRRFGAGDGAGAMRLFHPAITVEQPRSLPHGGVYRGADGLAAMGAAFGRHWDRVIENPMSLVIRSARRCSAGAAIMLTTQTLSSPEIQIPHP